MTDRLGLLAGVRIIESSMLGPGAITTHLADLGADVVKVEPPQGDYIRQMTWPIIEGNSLMHLHLHRGKRSLTLDLRTPEAVEVYLDLVRGADCVVEAMRPGGLERRGAREQLLLRTGAEGADDQGDGGEGAAECCAHCASSHSVRA